MKRILYAILATLSGLVLLFSYRTSLGESAVAAPEPVASTGSAAGVVRLPSASASPSPAATTPSSAEPSSSAPSAAAAAPASGLADGTYVGASVSTRYGAVQVQITVSGGQITDAQALDYPNADSRDRQINARAVPVLVSETLGAQSAGIDFVSGATFTSDGYQRSLQSALDKASA